MKENLLQYIWNYKLFRNFDFVDTLGNNIEILDFGKWNLNSGPDFMEGKIKINGIILVGNIELHVRTSDWIFHNHTGNVEFKNLILHAVFHDDAKIEELEMRNIPTLELRNFIDQEIIQKYQKIDTNNDFIPCENIFDANKIPFGFHEENILKKLDEKSKEIAQSLKKNLNNYEAILFQNLAYAFGLKVNAEIFRLMAENIDFTVLNKIRQNLLQTEALFFGMCGWLDHSEDDYMKILQREFDFLCTKYQLTDLRVHPKFSKLRPPNFPTLRLSQLASLYHQNQNLFSKIIAAENADDIYDIFASVKASNYWNNHFVFGKTSKSEHENTLTKDFVDLILINAILPLKYFYHKNLDENIADKITSFYQTIAAEKNTVTDRWKRLGLKASNALESQSLLYQFKNFCSEKKCLNCTVGFQLLKTQ